MEGVKSTLIKVLTLGESVTSLGGVCGDSERKVLEHALVSPSPTLQKGLSVE